VSVRGFGDGSPPSGDQPLKYLDPLRTSAAGFRSGVPVGYGMGASPV